MIAFLLEKRRFLKDKRSRLTYATFSTLNASNRRRDFEVPSTHRRVAEVKVVGAFGPTNEGSSSSVFSFLYLYL